MGSFPHYKGVHFSKYSSKRSNFNPKDGPGPGEYDVAEPIQVDVEHLHMKNTIDKKPDLMVPRYPEMMLKNVEKEVRSRVFFLIFKKN